MTPKVRGTTTRVLESAPPCSESTPFRGFYAGRNPYMVLHDKLLIHEHVTF